MSDPSSIPTILFCHANAGNMGLRMPNYKTFTTDLDSNVLACIYTRNEWRRCCQKYTRSEWRRCCQVYTRKSVVLVDYRGYGSSEGTPSEEGLLKDAEACINYLQNIKNIQRNVRISTLVLSKLFLQLFVFGRSLGGAVAIQTVVRNEQKSEKTVEIAGLSEV